MRKEGALGCQSPLVVSSQPMLLRSPEDGERSRIGIHLHGGKIVGSKTLYRRAAGDVGKVDGDLGTGRFRGLQDGKHRGGLLDGGGARSGVGVLKGGNAGVLGHEEDDFAGPRSGGKVLDRFHRECAGRSARRRTGRGNPGSGAERAGGKDGGDGKDFKHSVHTRFSVRKVRYGSIGAAWKRIIVSCQVASIFISMQVRCQCEKCRSVNISGKMRMRAAQNP
jgi:hypothetical protein